MRKPPSAEAPRVQIFMTLSPGEKALIDSARGNVPMTRWLRDHGIAAARVALELRDPAPEGAPPAKR